MRAGWIGVNALITTRTGRPYCNSTADQRVEGAGEGVGRVGGEGEADHGKREAGGGAGIDGELPLASRQATKPGGPLRSSRGRRAPGGPGASPRARLSWRARYVTIAASGLHQAAGPGDAARAGGGAEEAMANDVFPVPEAVARAAHCDDAKYQAMYRRSIDDPGRLLGASRRERLDWVKAADQDQGRRLQGQRPDPLVRGRRAQRQRQLHRPPSGDARRPDRDPVGGRRAGRRPARSPTASCTSRSAGSPTCSRAWASRRATGSRSTCR